MVNESEEGRKMTEKELDDFFDQNEKELNKRWARIYASDIVPICMKIPSEEIYREAVEIALKTSKIYLSWKNCE